MDHYAMDDEVVYNGAVWTVLTYTDENGEQWIERHGEVIVAHVDDLSYIDPLEWENNRAN